MRFNLIHTPHKMDTIPNELRLAIFSWLSDRHPVLRQVCILWKNLVPKSPLSLGVLLESEALWSWGGRRDTPALLALAAQLGNLNFLQSALKRGSLFEPDHCERHFHSLDGQIVSFKIPLSVPPSVEKGQGTGSLTCMNFDVWKKATRAGHLDVLMWFVEAANTNAISLIPEAYWDWTVINAVRHGHLEIFEAFSVTMDASKILALGILDHLVSYLSISCQPNHDFVERLLKIHLTFPSQVVEDQMQSFDLVGLMVPPIYHTRFHLLSQLSRWGFVNLIESWFTRSLVVQEIPITAQDVHAVLHGAINAPPELFSSLRISDLFELGTANSHPSFLVDLFSWIFLNTMTLPRRMDPLTRTQTLISLLRTQHPTLVVEPSYMEPCLQILLSNKSLDLVEWVLMEPHLRPGRWHLGIIPPCNPFHPVILSYAFASLPFDCVFSDAVLNSVYPKCTSFVTNPKVIALKDLLGPAHRSFFVSGDMLKQPLTPELVNWLGNHRHLPPFSWDDNNLEAFDEVVSDALKSGFCDLLPIYREWNSTLFSQVMETKRDSSILCYSPDAKRILSWVHHNGFPLSPKIYDSMATLFRMCGPLDIKSEVPEDFRGFIGPNKLTHLEIQRLVLFTHTKLKVPWDESSSHFIRTWKPFISVLSNKQLFDSLLCGGCVDGRVAK